MNLPIVLSMAGLLMAGISAHAQEAKPLSVDQRQCRSVHLFYKVPTQGNKAAYIQMTPQKNPDGTYFCALGFGEGYFGIQNITNGRKVVIFSVWDPGVDAFDPKTKPHEVPKEKQTQLIAKGEGVETSRFGGEGTGGKSMLNYAWVDNEPMQFLVTSKLLEDRQRVSGWFFDNKTKQWRLMSTWETRPDPKRLDTLYSFVEDFWRNGKSATQERRAAFGAVYVTNDAKTWQAIDTAKFSADTNPAVTIDAGVEKNSGLFFLQTGGATKMETTQLWGEIKNGSKQAQPLVDAMSVVEKDLK